MQPIQIATAVVHKQKRPPIPPMPTRAEAMPTPPSHSSTVVASAARQAVPVSVSEQELASRSAYLALMRRCWANSPAARPDFERIFGKLDGLLRACACDDVDGANNAAREPTHEYTDL